MRAIDADGVSEILTRVIEEQKKSYHDDEVIGLMEARTEVNNAPTLDVKPVVHAHWILDPDGMDFGLPAWLCSNCRRKNTMIPTFIATKHGGVVPKNPNIFEGSNYCPNCGAKMDEEDRDD